MHRLQQVDGAADVVLEVVQWAFAGFPHGLERREMKHGIEAATRKHAGDGGTVSHVHLVSLQVLAGQVLQPLEHLR